jgi:anaerobic magnesium-protoporphyrin IX monomethyl ester cyclase
MYFITKSRHDRKAYVWPSVTGMRILLINPFYPISENPSPPLGLAFLAAALESADIETRVLDLVVNPYSPKMLERLLTEFQPDAAGSTAVTMSFDSATAVLADIKAIDSDIKTIMGGPHVTFQSRETLSDHPEVDFIVLGEGEEAVVELVRAMERGTEYDHIAGLAYRNNGEITVTAPRTPGIPLDSLPVPARHLLPLGRYRALGMAISMTTSRGCPFHCIFCVGRKMVGSKVRYRNPIKVVDELAYLSRLGFHQVNIADDLFTAHKQHCLGVCDEILRRGLNVKWTSFARVDTVSPDVLARMKEAGCSAVSFGVETGNEQILKTIRKGITLDQVVAAATMCADAGITPHASFILGLPGETPDTLNETVVFGEKLKAMGVSHGFHLLAPFPGTSVRERSREYGLEILTDDWREYHANRAIVATASVSKEMLDSIVIRWENEFDSYLGDLKKRMQSGRATEEEAWPLVNLERCVLTYDLMMNRSIETLGAWSPTESNKESAQLNALIRRVTDDTQRPLDMVTDTLTHAWNKGHLISIRDSQKTFWKWLDHLPGFFEAD